MQKIFDGHVKSIQQIGIERNIGLPPPARNRPDALFIVFASFPDLESERTMYSSYLLTNLPGFVQPFLDRLKMFLVMFVGIASDKLPKSITFHPGETLWFKQVLAI